MIRCQTVCAEPGCPVLVERGRCAQHRRNTRQTIDRNYGTARWQRRRAHFRRRHPHCACGCGRPTQDVDHVIPRRILVAAGVHDPDDDQWLQPLAHACHSRKSQTVDRPLLAALDAGADPTHLAEMALAANRDWLLSS